MLAHDEILEHPITSQYKLVEVMVDMATISADVQFLWCTTVVEVVSLTSDLQLDLQQWVDVIWREGISQHSSAAPGLVAWFWVCSKCSSIVLTLPSPKINDNFCNVHLTNNKQQCAFNIVWDITTLCIINKKFIVLLTADKWNLYGVADCHRNRTFSIHSTSFHVGLAG